MAAGTGVAVGTDACWTEARQSVRTYVITAWLPRNPDGAPVLLRVCGRNAVIFPQVASRKRYVSEVSISSRMLRSLRTDVSVVSRR